MTTFTPHLNVNSLILLLSKLLFLFASRSIVSAFDFGAAPVTRRHQHPVVPSARGDADLILGRRDCQISRRLAFDVTQGMIREPLSARCDDCHVDGSSNCHVSRRSTFQKGMHGVVCGVLLIDSFSPRHANAALFGGKERRQLEFCLVNLLRVTYWSESLVQYLKTTDDEEKRKKVYLEARLGAKALVTGKVGGGATNRIYQLSTLQFRGCLEDIAYYGKSRQVSELCQDLLESIAQVVEFDGLETTTDPSPRSSLTLSMFNPNKATYVERLLSERVIPLSLQLCNSFDPDIRQRCKDYVASTYPNEVPNSAKVISNNSIE